MSAWRNGFHTTWRPRTVWTIQCFEEEGRFCSLLIHDMLHPQNK
jgi:hypothetical protein